MGDEQHTLDATAHVEKSPGLASRHRVRRKPDERGESHDEVIEQFQRARGRLGGAGLKIRKRAVNFAKDAPGIGGDGIAQDSREAVKVRNRAAQVLGFLISQHRADEFTFQFRPGRTHGLGSARGRQNLQGVGTFESGLVDHARQRAAREPRLGVGALRITSQPEEILGEAARQIASSAAEGNGLARRGEERHGADGRVGQNPGVLAPPAFLQGYDERVIRLRDARQAAVHHRVRIAVRAQIGADDETARLQILTDQGRRGARRKLSLGDEVCRMRLDSPFDRRDFIAASGWNRKSGPRLASGEPT